VRRSREHYVREIERAVAAHDVSVAPTPDVQVLGTAR
jgi:hypothetical protein